MTNPKSDCRRRQSITSWKAQTHGFAIKLKDRSDQATADAVLRMFSSLANGAYKGIFRVVTRTEMDGLAADPDAFIALEPVEGYMVGASVDGGSFVAASTRRGQHGYLPGNPQLRTGLIVAGAGVRPGIEVPFARQIDIAPTVARLLGLDMKAVDGIVMAGLIK